MLLLLTVKNILTTIGFILLGFIGLCFSPKLRNNYSFLKWADGDRRLRFLVLSIILILTGVIPNEIITSLDANKNEAAVECVQIKLIFECYPERMKSITQHPELFPDLYVEVPYEYVKETEKLAQTTYPHLKTTLQSLFTKDGKWYSPKKDTRFKFPSVLNRSSVENSIMSELLDDWSFTFTVQDKNTDQTLIERHGHGKDNVVSMASEEVIHIYNKYSTGGIANLVMKYEFTNLELSKLDDFEHKLINFSCGGSVNGKLLLIRADLSFYRNFEGVLKQSPNYSWKSVTFLNENNIMQNANDGYVLVEHQSTITGNADNWNLTYSIPKKFFRKPRCKFF